MRRAVFLQGIVAGILALVTGCASRGTPEPHAGAFPDRWPVASAAARVTSPFGYRVHPITGERRMHNGIDISAPSGTPVYATAAGRVAFSGKQTGYGHIVVVDHGGGIETAYAHLRERRVSAGESVRAGDRVGDVGRSGWATGHHLQYEVRRDGRHVDPMPYLPRQMSAR